MDLVLVSMVFGVCFLVLFGLVVGFDKDGIVLFSWGVMGFGYVEIGIVIVYL